MQAAAALGAQVADHDATRITTRNACGMGGNLGSAAGVTQFSTVGRITN